MPNYSYNQLTIDGPNDELDKLAAAVADASSNDRDDRFSYEKILPLAPCEDEATVWGSCSLYCLELDRTAGDLTYRWQSSWDPPLAVVNALAAQWPELSFEFVYCEAGTGRYGSRSLVKGKTAHREDGGSYWEGDDSDLQSFLHCYWPQLAEKWWGPEDDEDEYDYEENPDWEEAA
jgi:hypothetical protein